MVLSALEAFSHLAQVIIIGLAFPVMVSLTMHLNPFTFQFGVFFNSFFLFLIFSESLRKWFC